MEKKEIEEIIDFMKILYPNAKKLKKDNQTLDAWFMMLEEYSVDDVKRTIKSLYTKVKYLPTIQEIVEVLEQSFKVRFLDARNFTVFVDFNDSRFPFIFEKKEDARDLISFLKTMPSRKDVEYYYNEFTLKRNKHVTTLKVDQRDREEFDNRIRNAYYANKVKSF